MLGQTLLHYRITDRLGAGGMGEVYRATDTNLNRDVAIKVLPAEVAQDAERLGRFRREAHLLASLNHPNIATIHGLEEANGQPFLVLELVEGEDLEERVDRGAIPVEEALEIARQIAEALEEAHSHGIVHRDLKPANVKLTPEGKVKVLDFGLAKAWAGETGSGTSSLDLSASPTLARSGTLAGVILGTAAYMSPEQAAGKSVDRRADIWSFGVVLFEMLTGQPLFTGETASEILASVIKEEPDWNRLPDACPPAIHRLLRRCLRRKPRERLQDAGDARLELVDALAEQEEHDGSEPFPSGASASLLRRARFRERAWAAVALALGGLAAYSIWHALAPPAPASRPAVHVDVRVPDQVSVLDADPAVSPDGRHVAFTGRGQKRQLWVRSLDANLARPLPGTEGATTPVWAPDSGSMAFHVPLEGDVHLKRVDLASGAVRAICTVPGGLFGTATWSRQGRILFTVGDATGARIHSVSASGGEPQVVMEVDPNTGHWFPEFLPDGRRFLFGEWRNGVNGLWVTSLDAPEERRQLLPGVMRAQVSASGHLLHVREGTLWALPFDLARAELTGGAAAVASPVGVFSGWAPANWGLFSISTGEMLVYSEREGASGQLLVWFDRKGARLETVAGPDGYTQVQLSPDETRVVAAISNDDGLNDLWTLDLDRGVTSRVTTDPAEDSDPLWAPDGRELFFDSNRGDGTIRLHRKRLDGSGPVLLLDSTEHAFPEHVSPDGRFLIYLTGYPPANDSVWALPLSGGDEPELLLEASSPIDEPQVSPDGRWLAYSADETGDWEVYLMPFRRKGARVVLSSGGGRQPRWRGDGKELLYVTAHGQLMAVSVEAVGERLEVGRPQALFDAGVSSAFHDQYCVSKDGQRFLVIAPAETAGGSFRVIQNWTSLLE